MLLKNVYKQIYLKIWIAITLYSVILLAQKIYYCMCGIAGAINFNLPYQQLNQAMYHRGPDAQNGYSIDNIDLYHFRLSILDVAGGVQPMHLNNAYTIIFNGEIYNHADIRAQHKIQGHTASDTETLLLLYEKFGINFLQYLEGMFVFALYDKQKKTIVYCKR